jgi:anti-sigma regulatory factor (Ser/Thr protein kinase)
MAQLRQQYTSDLGQLAQMRAALRAVCEQAWGADAPLEAIHQLELAVAEAASNIVLHAYDRVPGQPIEVVIDSDPLQVCVSLYHGGRDFEPEAVARPAFDGSQESGFGMYLMRQCVDDVQYVHDNEGRCGIRLVKRKPGL